MEDDDNISKNSSNHFNNDGDKNQIVQQLLLTNIISSKRKEFFLLYDIRNFPDSLLIEILARLPVKSIFMFKIVCKHWETLISHPSFSRLYHSILNSNTATLPFRILHTFPLVTNCKEFVNCLTPEVHSSSEFSVLFLRRKEQLTYSEFRVLDTSNGLILCSSLLSPTPFVYYICDPLTRQCITIPGYEFNTGFCEGLITRVNEDHMLTGFTVVRVEHIDFRLGYLILDMFSSETGEWIVYMMLPFAIPIQMQSMFYRGGSPIHCYGALHWRFTHGLVAFDPCKDLKSVRQIPYPEGRDLQSEQHDRGRFQSCGESQGTLRYFQVADDPTGCYFLTMWAMKDYEKGEWCCEFRVRHNDVHFSDLKLSNWLLGGWFYPLSFHPLNQNVVYLWCELPKCVVSYDVLNRRLDVVCKTIDIGRYISSGISGILIPFVLPRWPVLVSIATVKSKLKGVKCVI